MGEVAKRHDDINLMEAEESRGISHIVVYAGT